MILIFMVLLFMVILFISMLVEFDSDFNEDIFRTVMHAVLLVLYLASIFITAEASFKEGCINASIGKPDYQLIINDDSTRTWEKIWEINNETDR